MLAKSSTLQTATVQRRTGPRVFGGEIGPPTWTVTFPDYSIPTKSTLETKPKHKTVKIYLMKSR